MFNSATNRLDLKAAFNVLFKTPKTSFTVPEHVDVQTAILIEIEDAKDPALTGRINQFQNLFGPKTIHMPELKSIQYDEETNTAKVRFIFDDHLIQGALANATQVFAQSDFKERIDELGISKVNILAHDNDPAMDDEHDETGAIAQPHI